VSAPFSRDHDRTMRTRTLLFFAALAVSGSALAACSPVYVVRAGIAEAKILRNRQPLADVVLDPATDADTRGKLTFAMEAREFAQEELGFDVGKSYTSYTELDSDTLVMVLSAAHRNRLEARTWWFPVVGRVPYRGFFNVDRALREQRKLEAEGFDTYLRPAAAFSTLGWFADPILSTMLRYDDVGLVDTILHELAHAHLFIPGQVTFNESFGSFVGAVGAIEFFCGREGGGPDTVKCERARLRWQDQMRFSRFMDEVVERTRALLARDDLSRDEKLAARERLFDELREQFRDEVQPDLQPGAFASFLSMPLNNATLLARMRYYHRLEDFEALRQAHGGSLRTTVEAVRREARGLDDPFSLLPTVSTARHGRPAQSPAVGPRPG
jgi:predicted aminopeptidase